MTACDHPTQSSRALLVTVPSLFQRLLQPTLLLPGENHGDYESLRDMVIAEIEPQSGIEWLWTADLVELSWDIVRYRALRQKMLEVRRKDAIEAMLRRIDLAGIPQASLPLALNRTKQNADQWRSDPSAGAEIEARLINQGIDEGSLNAEVLIQAGELFIMFDNLIQSAQTRRILLLREINRRRMSLEIERASLTKRRTASGNKAGETVNHERW
jgi:hypothetical protein